MLVRILLGFGQKCWLRLDTNWKRYALKWQLRRDKGFCGNSGMLAFSSWACFLPLSLALRLSGQKWAARNGNERTTHYIKQARIYSWRQFARSFLCPQCMLPLMLLLLLRHRRHKCGALGRSRHSCGVFILSQIELLRILIKIPRLST